ncbi:MAG: hypothetical protein WDW38_003357 [Sanguina aurantia]
MADQSVTYSLRHQARALAAQAAEKFNSRWLVGTNSLKEENEIRVLQYDQDQERLLCLHAYTHHAEVWDIAPCPTSELSFVTVWSKAGVYGASLWLAPQQGSALTQQAELSGHTGVIRRALWHPVQSSLLVTVEEGAIRAWAVSDAGVQSTSQAPAGDLMQLWGGALHPSNPDVLATAGGNNLQIWDLRSMSKSSEITGAHKMPVRDVSFAPQNNQRIVSAGDDCKLRVWDLRMSGKSEAVLELGGHSHWVWRVQFNAFHDQLLASSSSDTLVNLYHTPQAASRPTEPSRPDTGKPKSGGGKAASSARGDLDGKVHTYDEHEDSVYGLAWSAVEPWLFASLSYDGRVVINKVPKNTKYKILL